jgi:hypothetical protein
MRAPWPGCTPGRGRIDQINSPKIVLARKDRRSRAALSRITAVGRDKRTEPKGDCSVSSAKMHKLPLFWILVLVIAVGVVVGYYVSLM